MWPLIVVLCNNNDLIRIFSIIFLLSIPVSVIILIYIIQWNWRIKNIIESHAVDKLYLKWPVSVFIIVLLKHRLSYMN